MYLTIIINLKLKTKEARVTKEALNNLLVENEKENDGLKLEVVSLRKKVQENNMDDSSGILKQIISNQRPTNDKTGIGYKSESTNASTSTIFEKVGTGHTNVKNTSKQMESVKHEGNQTSIVHRRSYDRYWNRFDGYRFFCYKYGHKYAFCNSFSRNIISHNSHEKSRFDYGRRHDRTIQNSVNNSYNRFDILRFEGEWHRCNNFGHVSRNYPMNFHKSVEPNYTNLKTRCWKKKSDC